MIWFDQNNIPSDQRYLHRNFFSYLLDDNYDLEVIDFEKKQFLTTFLMIWKR